MPYFQEFDWSQTPLGPRASWPPALATTWDIMQSAHVAMCATWGPEQTLLYNAAYAPILGPRHPTALGQPIQEVWAELWDEIAPLIARAMAGERMHFTNRHLVMTRHGHPEDTWWDFSYSALRDGDRVVGFLNVTTDATAQVLSSRQRDAAEVALRDQNTELTQVVTERTAERDRLWETTTDLMGTATLDGRLLEINPAWTVLLGWTEEQLLTRPFIKIIHPDDHAETAHVVEQLSKGEAVTSFVDRVLMADGGERSIMWTATPETNARAGKGLFYIVGRDVTDQLRAEDALRQSQKMEAVGQLTGGVAHDFNNLLTVIKSSSDLLKRPNLPEERRIRYVEAISSTVDRAAKLTGQLLAFARRQNLKPVAFHASDSVRALTEMMSTLTGSRIKIVTELHDACCKVHADPSQFDTALVNMAVNARDAMDGAGQLTITVREVDALPARRSHAARHKAHVAISLSDTGTGIAPDQLDRIFEPFFTTKEVGKGTGLGLSQVFGFAKQSGGDVTVASTVGQGTTFTLYLPCAAPGLDREEQSQAVPAEALATDHGTRVLVVEDNADVGSITAQTLRDLGYETQLAADAGHALDELAQAPGRFDVVFTDVVMPGMDGIALGEEIRKLYHDLPVVLASGYSHVLVEEGHHGFELLQKPYSVEDLSRVLYRAAIWKRRQRLVSN